MSEEKAKDVIIKIFGVEEKAKILLVQRFGFPVASLPGGSLTPQSYWSQVFQDIEDGITEDDLSKLFEIAGDMYPGNRDLAIWRQPRSKPGERSGPSVTIPEVEDIRGVIALAREVAEEVGLAGLEPAFTSEENLCIYLGDATREQTRQFAGAMGRRLADQGRNGNVEEAEFRDYLFSSLIVEGPDQGRFELIDVPASTRTGDIGSAVLGEYAEEMQPVDPQGSRRPITVDRNTEEGSQRMDPDRSLHENGVQDGDTLHVAQESTAGNLLSGLRDEALVRARLQINRYAANHPGFKVKANAKRSPTRYRLSFSAPGWGPPEGPDSKPYPIEDHIVEIYLLADFPMKAPLVFWRVPFFHPNVDQKTGGVCLGMLADQYRPTLDMGELCQIILDLGAYRNHEVGNPLNPDAREWATTPEAQLLIEQRGGISPLRKVLQQFHQPRRLRVRRI